MKRKNFLFSALAALVSMALAGCATSGFYPLQSREKIQLPDGRLIYGNRLADGTIIQRFAGNRPGISGPEVGTSDLYRCKADGSDCKREETNVAASPGFAELFWGGAGAAMVGGAAFVGGMSVLRPARVKNSVKVENSEPLW